MKALMTAKKFIISLRSFVPALVLDEGIIGAQIHRHRLAADGTLWDQLGGDFHILLKLDHVLDAFLIVIGLIVARLTALEESVIALSVEKALFVEACLLELVVNICSDNKIVLVLYKPEQLLVSAVVDVHIAVAPDKPDQYAHISSGVSKGKKPPEYIS